MKIAPKNWNDFQHYKKRNPPWIRLYRKLLDDRAFQCLPLASKALAPMLWLLASEHPSGVIDADYEHLSWRLRMLENDVRDGLGPLIGKGFFDVVEFDASNVLAEREQHAMPETETETEKNKKTSPPKNGGPVWTDALTLLTEQGHSEKSARAFLGMLLRDFEEADIVDAAKASVGAADITAYMRGVLKSKPKRSEGKRVAI